VIISQVEGGAGDMTTDEKPECLKSELAGVREWTGEIRQA